MAFSHSDYDEEMNKKLMQNIIESPLHPHEPAIPPAFDNNGSCLVCGLIIERDRYRAALDRLDNMDPGDFKVGQDHLSPAFREPNFLEALRFVMKVVNGVLHNTDEYGKPL